MRIGPYEVVASVGSGGAGTVYRARGPSGEEVAIKVLRQVNEETRARFERERRLLASLTEREGFVPLLDSGTTPEGPWIVMPLVMGGSLRERLRRGPLTIDETSALAVSLASALARAHERGIVHRDLKPENVLFTADGRSLVADLGLGKHFDSRAPGASQSVSLSRSGTARGTFGYMPLEQMNDAASVGPAADVFAVGAILYECLAGKPAFDGETFVQLFDAVSAGEIEPLAELRPEAPRWLTAAIEHALAPSPADRPADGSALVAALAPRAPTSRRAAFGLAVAGAIGLGVLAAVLLRPRLGVNIEAPPQGLETPEDEVLVTASTTGGVAARVVAGERETTAAIDSRGRIEAMVSLPAVEGPVALVVRIRDARGGEAESRVTIRHRAWGPGERLRVRRQAAEAGDVRAMLDLATASGKGQDVPYDVAEALRWLQKAAEAGSPEGMFDLAYALQAGPRRDLSEAVRWYRAAALAGDARAMGNLARMLAEGTGAPRDDVEAVKWWRKAAETGADDHTAGYAALELGGMLRAGRGGARDETEAVRWFREALRRLRRLGAAGDSSAMVNVGLMYGNGLGVEENKTEAMRWYLDAAEKGNVVAMVNIAVDLDGDGLAGDHAKAAEWWQKAALGGDADGMANWGNWLAEVGRESEAIDWYRKGALAGHAGCMNELGFRYGGGRGVPLDEAEAFRWYLASAKGGFTRAMVNVALMYEEGRGGEKNEAEAVGWARTAAERGDARAMRLVAKYFENGVGGPKNETEAASWYRKAADQGEAPAMDALGRLYLDGRGVPRNDAEALRWFRASAERGDPWGILDVGAMYMNGRGVGRDYDEAARLFRKSADKGNWEAMDRLGQLFEEGLGVEPDLPQAIEWYRKGAARGDGLAREALRRLHAE